MLIMCLCFLHHIFKGRVEVEKKKKICQMQKTKQNNKKNNRKWTSFNCLLKNKKRKTHALGLPLPSYLFSRFKHFSFIATALLFHFAIWVYLLLVLFRITFKLKIIFTTRSILNICNTSSQCIQRELCILIYIKDI